MKTVCLSVLVQVFALVMMGTIWPERVGAQAYYKKITGEFSILSGRSDWPAAGGGLGPYEQFRIGAKIKAQTKRVVLYGEGSVGGGTPYDNPERLSLEFGAAYKLGPCEIGLHFQDYYALNRFKVPDPAARDPMSSVNQTWLGSDCHVEVDGRGLILKYWRAIRGSFPLFWPEHYTKPYAVNRFGSFFEYPLGRGFSLVLEPAVYTTDRFDQARMALEISLDKPVWHGWLILTVYGFLDSSLGVKDERHFTGEELKRTTRGLFAGIKIPLGHEEH